MLETLLQLRHKIRHVVVPRNNGGGLADPSLKLVLEAAGFASVIEIDELGAIETADGAITSIPFFGEHGDLNIRSKTTYLVRLLGRSFLFCADSNAFEPRLYDHLADIVGELDVAFIGMECDGAPDELALRARWSRLRSRAGWTSPGGWTPPTASVAWSSSSACARGRSTSTRWVPEPWLTYLTSIHYTESVPADRGVARARPASARRSGICAETLFGNKELQLAMTPNGRRAPARDPAGLLPVDAARRRSCCGSGTTPRSTIRADETIPSLFEEQARRAPEAIALVSAAGRVDPDVRRAQPARQPARASPADSRRPAGDAGRDPPGTLVRHDRRDARRPEGGRRLRSPRPAPSAQATWPSCSRTAGRRSC